MNLKRFLYALPNHKELETNAISIFKKLINDTNDLKSGVMTFEIYKNDDFFLILIEAQSGLALVNVLDKFNSETFTPKNTTNVDDFRSLERIFQKPLSEKQCPESNESFKRFIFTLELKPEDKLLETYKEIHKPNNIPAQVIANMDTIGVRDMELYLYNSQAFLIMDTHPGFDLEKDGNRWSNLPQEKEWQQYVAKFQKVNPEDKSTDKWINMQSIILK